MERVKDEEGMIMVEAIYVVVITILIIFFAINIGIIYHNRIAVTASANEAASGVARIYSRLDKEPFYAYMDKEDFKKINPYRYLRYEGAYTDVTERKAKWYASYLVYQSEFAVQKDMAFDGVVTSCEKNAIGQQMLSVTVTRKYPVFDMNPVVFFGLDPQYEVSATGTAICYDPIYQMNQTAFVDEIQNTVMDHAIGETLGHVMNIIAKVRSVLEQ